jgi:hypothetical protein
LKDLLGGVGLMVWKWYIGASFILGTDDG